MSKSIEKYKYSNIEELGEARAFSQGRSTPPSGFVRVQVEKLFPLVVHLKSETSPSRSEDTDSKVLSPSALKVLTFLLARMQYRNWVFLSQVAIGEQLGVSPQALNRALDLLESRNLLQRVYFEKRYRCLIVSPELATKGSNNDIEDCQKAYKEIKEKNQYRPRRTKTADAT